MARKFKIVVASFNSYDFLVPSLESIAEQGHDAEVCVVDDGSPDPRCAKHVWEMCGEHGWQAIIHAGNQGTLFGQVEAMRALDADPDDVIVFVDGDDRLAHPEVLDRLEEVYDTTGCHMTYGSYQSVPYSSTCGPASPYPPICIAERDYRNLARWGCPFNHLRTITGRLFDRLVSTDFMFNDGRWYKAAGDTAVMLPCLELANGAHEFIPETLLLYSSENPISDWRVRGNEILAAFADIQGKGVRDPLFYGGVDDQQHHYAAIDSVRGDRKLFIETGTADGQKIRWGVDRFPRLATVEYFGHLFEQTAARARTWTWRLELIEGMPTAAPGRGVTMIRGDSTDVVVGLSKLVAEPAVWFLDAHSVDPNLVAPSGTSPILVELAAILYGPQSVHDHAVIIDDARLFGVEPGWPTVDVVRAMVENADYKMAQMGDELVVTR